MSHSQDWARKFNLDAQKQTEGSLVAYQHHNDMVRAEILTEHAVKQVERDLMAQDKKGQLDPKLDEAISAAHNNFITKFKEFSCIGRGNKNLLMRLENYELLNPLMWNGEGTCNNAVFLPDNPFAQFAVYLEAFTQNFTALYNHANDEEKKAGFGAILKLAEAIQEKFNFPKTGNIDRCEPYNTKRVAKLRFEQEKNTPLPEIWLDKNGNKRINVAELAPEMQVIFRYSHSVLNKLMDRYGYSVAGKDEGATAFIQKSIQLYSFAYRELYMAKETGKRLVTDTEDAQLLCYDDWLLAASPSDTAYLYPQNVRDAFAVYLEAQCAVMQGQKILAERTGRQDALQALDISIAAANAFQQCFEFRPEGNLEVCDTVRAGDDDGMYYEAPKMRLC